MIPSAAMKPWRSLTALVLSFAALQPQEKRDWIDPDTGHRVVRLTDDAGGSTLYFPRQRVLARRRHADVQHAQRHCRCWTSRRSAGGTRRLRSWRVDEEDTSHAARREIYFTNADGRGSDASDQRRQRGHETESRQCPHARGLINADESLSVVKNGNAADPDGKYPKPPVRVAVPQLQRMFPGKTNGGSHTRSAVLSDEGGRPGATSAQSRACSHSSSPT